MPTLYLIPSPLTDTITLIDIPESTQTIIKSLNLFFVESKKRAAAFLKAAGKTAPFELVELNEHTNQKDLLSMIDLLKDTESQNAAVLSDAGAPCIADPGTALVWLAHKAKIKVVPLTGPSSILQALMASGLSGQRFRFLGYLPKDEAARRKALLELENQALSHGESQVFIETPYRVKHLLDTISKVCNQDLSISLAIDLREPHEKITTCKIKELTANHELITAAEGRRVVFILG